MDNVVFLFVCLFCFWGCGRGMPGVVDIEKTVDRLLSEENCVKKCEPSAKLGEPKVTFYAFR